MLLISLMRSTTPLVLLNFPTSAFEVREMSSSSTEDGDTCIDYGNPNYYECFWLGLSNQTQNSDRLETVGYHILICGTYQPYFIQSPTIRGMVEYSINVTNTTGILMVGIKCPMWNASNPGQCLFSLPLVMNSCQKYPEW